MREVMTNEPLPEQVSVSSIRRILIQLNLSSYEAKSLADAIWESRGYLEMHSPGGWESDPRMLVRLEEAIRAELAGAAQAPSPGEFLTGQGDGEDGGDDDDGTVDPGDDTEGETGNPADPASEPAPSSGGAEPTADGQSAG
jgi:hypothetical protein